MDTLNFDPRQHPDHWELVGHDPDGVPIYKPVEVDGCGGCENGECCGACDCCTEPAKGRFDVIGRLTVTDELGVTHEVVIHREDLTTTNGAYQAIRDTVVDQLRWVLEFNRTV